MARSLTLNRRSAAWATLFFLLFAYEAQRTVAVVTGHLTWIPHLAPAPSWVRVGFHAALAVPAFMLCAKWAYRTIISMELHLTPHMTVAGARQTVAGPWFERRLPPAPEGSFSLRLNRLDDWRWWSIGAGLFLVTAVPYWLLLGLVGHIMALGPFYLALQVGNQLPWWLAATVGVLALAALVVHRRRKHRSPPADKAPLIILAFMGGSEEWTARQRWHACVLYSLWLQRHGVFPFLTLATAIPSQRLIMELYRREISAGRSPNEALSHILMLRVARIAAALFFYAVIAVIKFWPLIW